MIEKKKVIEIVNKWLEGKNYFLTDLTVDENNHIVVEIDDKEGVWIDDCVDLSKYIESYLNRDEEDYELEVGSAGLGQPFKVLQQYYNHVGDEVEVLTQGGKKFKGVLKDVDEQGVVVTVLKKIKPEGAKRPKMEAVSENYSFADLRSVSYAIDFKKLKLKK